ncbi:MAG: hypothetical protein WA960_15870 [Tunicatimonas sp.]
MELNQKINFYEKRDFGEKINVTFAFLRQNFAPLAKSILYIAGPAILLIAVVTGIYQAALLNLGGETDSLEGPIGLVRETSPMDILSVYSQGTLTSFLSIFASALLVTVVYAYLVLYVEREDYDNITVAEVWERVKQHYLVVVVSTFVYSVLVVLGFMLLIIPGFIAIAALSFLFIIQIKEGLSLGAAFSRCFKLVSDNYLSTLGLIFVTSILIAIISMVVMLPFGLALGVPTFFSLTQGNGLEDSEGTLQIFLIIFQALSSLLSYLLYAILLIAVAFQYANLVEKKEAAGLLESVNTIGQTTQPTREDETY